MPSLIATGHKTFKLRTEPESHKMHRKFHRLIFKQFLNDVFMCYSINYRCDDATTVVDDVRRHLCAIPFISAQPIDYGIRSCSR